MLPPEIQRVVLLIALAAVGYLLILAWTEDMQAAKTPTVYSDAPLVSQQSSVAEAELPSVDEFKLIDSDIPAETVAPSAILVDGSQRWPHVYSAKRFDWPGWH